MKLPTESAIRTRARGRGYIVKKSRVRNPTDPRFGMYMLVNLANAAVLYDPRYGFGVSLEEIAEFLENPLS